MVRKKKTTRARGPLPDTQHLTDAQRMKICWIVARGGDVILTTTGLACAHFASAELCAEWLRHTADKIAKSTAQSESEPQP